METITIYGIRAIIEAIDSEKPIDKVWLLKGSKSKLFDKLLYILRSKKIAFTYVPKERLERFSSKNHQGAVARVAAIETKEIEPLVESVMKSKKNPVFVLLDGITDTRNFGAILRSAAAFGVDAIFISNTGSAPLNADVVKTSAGAAFKVPIVKVNHLKDVVYLLKTYKIPCLGITEKAKETLYRKDFEGSIAVVFGSEDIGISNGLLKILDDKAKIPMQQSINSLNVSVACGVIFYEIIRQRGFIKA